jgi:hypothetical protein
MHAVEDLMEDMLGAYVIRMALTTLGLTVEEGFDSTEADTRDVQSIATKVVQQLTCISGEQSKDKVLQHTQVRITA